MGNFCPVIDVRNLFPSNTCLCIIHCFVAHLWKPGILVSSLWGCGCFISTKRSLSVRPRLNDVEVEEIWCRVFVTDGGQGEPYSKYLAIVMR